MDLAESRLTSTGTKTKTKNQNIRNNTDHLTRSVCCMLWMVTWGVLCPAKAGEDKGRTRSALWVRGSMRREAAISETDKSRGLTARPSHGSFLWVQLLPNIKITISIKIKNYIFTPRKWRGFRNHAVRSQEVKHSNTFQRSVLNTFSLQSHISNTKQGGSNKRPVLSPHSKEALVFSSKTSPLCQKIKGSSVNSRFLLPQKPLHQIQAWATYLFVFTVWIHKCTGWL